MPNLRALLGPMKKFSSSGPGWPIRRAQSTEEPTCETPTETTKTGQQPRHDTSEHCDACGSPEAIVSARYILAGESIAAATATSGLRSPGTVPAF